MQNGVEGACGKVNPDSAIICALQTSLYANGANCGKTVRVTNLVNMQTVDVIVAGELSFRPPHLTAWLIVSF